MPRWLLPENISDILPLEARRVEELRRALLDLYRGYGYELVIPPLIEYLDSLLTGTGSDLDLRMFKLTDQASGRLLGLRADATPQVARIDAHILNRKGVARLCYAGSVLHARPLHPLASREPLQVGAELYGVAGPQADAEVIELAVASLRLAGLSTVHLDLGHTAVVRALLDLAAPAPAVVDDLLAALSSKDEPWLRAIVAGMPRTAAEALLELVRLNGGAELIDQARARLPALPPIGAALDELETIAKNCGADVSFDLADLHGYRYHNGVTFAVHVEGLPAAVLRGGRYDGIGKAFGRARPAVGFSIYLRDLARLGEAASPRAILAPARRDPALRALVRQLREAGEVVVQALPGEEEQAGDFVFDREIAQQNGNWSVVARTASPAK
jgi:ATP phosphoribosyltransferase regulatory subunit